MHPDLATPADLRDENRFMWRYVKFLLFVVLLLSFSYVSACYIEPETFEIQITGAI